MVRAEGKNSVVVVCLSALAVVAIKHSAKGKPPTFDALERLNMIEEAQRTAGAVGLIYSGTVSFPNFDCTGSQSALYQIAFCERIESDGSS